MNTQSKALKPLICIFALILTLSLLLVGCKGEEQIHFPADGDAADAFADNDKNDKNDKIDKNEEPEKADAKPNSSPSNSSGKKRVAITYDDGPHNVRTKAIVDELDKYGFNATFFVVGNRIDGSAYDGSSALKYAASKGNELAIHAYTHNNYYNKCSDKTYEEELSLTYKAIKDEVPNAKVSLMRPVGGAITQERIDACKYSVVLWDVDSEDWKYKSTNDDVAQKNVDTIVDNVMSSVKNGSIILMHDLYENTYLATKEILKRLNAQGYEVVTVSELIGNPQPGVRYSRG